MIVGIYARVSTQEQANNYSIAEQVERLSKYCESFGWIISKKYIDPGFSGASLDRPGLTNLINDVQSGKLQKVVVYKLDRLSRSQLDTLYLIEKVFLSNSVDFVSMSENFDTSTPFGKAMIGILAVFAQLEREQIKERMQMGKAARAKDGKFMATWNVPIGYDYINGELVTNEFEKAQVQEVYNLFLSGTPIKRMITILKEKGFSHKYGFWNDRTIRNVLRSKTYVGYINYRDQWYLGAHEAFITDEQHNKAVAILDERKRLYEAHRRPGKAQSYLGGLIYCARCGAKYAKRKGYKRKDGFRHSYYACYSRLGDFKLAKSNHCNNKFWDMSELDNIVFNEVRKLAIDPAYYERVSEQNNRLPAIEAEAEKLLEKINKLLDLYLTDMPIDVLQKRIEEYTRQKEALEAEAQRIREEQKKQLSQNRLKDFGEVLDKGDFAQIRTVLTSLIDRIVIDGEDVTIRWNFS